MTKTMCEDCAEKLLDEYNAGDCISSKDYFDAFMGLNGEMTREGLIDMIRISQRANELLLQSCAMMVAAYFVERGEATDALATAVHDSLPQWREQYTAAAARDTLKTISKIATEASQ